MMFGLLKRKKQISKPKNQKFHCIIQQTQAVKEQRINFHMTV